MVTNQKTQARRPRLTRRCVARFLIENQQKPAYVSMQVGKDGWHGVTAFPTNERYLKRPQTRGGVLAWRRTEAE